MRNLFLSLGCLALAACGGGGGGGSAGGSPPPAASPTITAVQASNQSFTGGSSDIVVTVSAADATALAAVARLPALDRQVALSYSAGAFRGSLLLPGNADATGTATQWQVEAILSQGGVELDRDTATVLVSAPPMPPALP